ncbi:AP-1 complex subunit beta-1 [Nematocida displodere]|uniref:AP-1 complex subunit beta-1 n=1 Tax=Nematocida displodere TaxID=1805483 RepID=A0A177EDX7_9MICR|nr:AP-1 complex subunit beta-1 [Nematocida displodere]
MYTFTNSLLGASGGRKNLFADIKTGLASMDGKKVMSTLHMVSRIKLSSKQKALLFPRVVSLVLHESLEIKSGAYSYILRTIDLDKTLLLLVVNTVLQEIRAGGPEKAPTSALRKALAIDFISKIRDKEFLGHFCDVIEEALSSPMDIVRKSALLAAPTLFKVFGEVKMAPLKTALYSKSACVVGSGIFAITAIEKEKKGSFEEEDLLKCLGALCAFRAEIEESMGGFGELFLEVCRALRPFTRRETVEGVLPVVSFLPLFALRELILSSEGFLTPGVGEKIAGGLIGFLGHEMRVSALEILLLLVQKVPMSLDASLFYIDGGDGRKEKMLKLQILSLLRGKEALSEIRSFISDRDCTFTALSLLLSLGEALKEDLVAAFRYSVSASLRALYTQHPLPAHLEGTVAQLLAPLSNVAEKEAFLYLGGYYLRSIPDEAKRIRRIRNSAGGILYGRKDEREKAEEHLEEYLYFLLNLFAREMFSKEECIKQAGDAFAEEPFLHEKFTHLIDLPDRTQLLSLISYKRVLYKMDSLAVHHTTPIQ